MNGIPKSLRLLKEERILEIDWPGDRSERVLLRTLRILCPCAACVNEFTGERSLNPADVPDDVMPTSMEFAGNYGLKVAWTDGHHSGIYTWENLDRISAASSA